MLSLHSLHAFGQSAWLNYLRRAFLESGELGDLLEEGIGGITSTPALFAKAISHSSDYDETLLRLLAQGRPLEEIHERLVIDDMQRAADLLHPVYEATNGLDGYVSVELDPAVIDDAVQTAAAARRLLRAIDRGNAMIEIPATPAGITAVRELTSDGVCVNVTHVFSPTLYEKVAEAYIEGLEQYFETHTVWRIAPSSVVSFSLSRIDHAVDEALARLPQNTLRAQLMGRAAIALAKVAYDSYQEYFSGARWEKLARRGARPLRLKWTRTTPRNFTYPDTHYVEALIGPDTVMTFSLATLNAFRQHGVVAATLLQDHTQARRLLLTLADLGIDLELIAARLQRDSLADFRQQFQALRRSVQEKRDQLQSGWLRLQTEMGEVETAVARNITTLCRESIPGRLWQHDHTLWQLTPTGAQLGWLHVVEAMQENVAQMNSFVRQAQQDGLHTAVLLGVGGATAAAKALVHVAGAPSGMAVHMLDSVHPHTVRQLTRQLDLKQTLFVVASKEGDTFETMALFRHFHNLVCENLGLEQAGRHFAAITDNGSLLHTLASRHHFRHVFLNDPTVPETYSALSYFALVPALLAGVDITAVLDSALAQVSNSSSCNCPDKGDNWGVQLGAILAALVTAGRDKLTLLAAPALRPFADWVAHLLAVSLGKQQKGLVPLINEPWLETAAYGPDRAFVYLQLPGETPPYQLQELVAARHPLIVLRWQSREDIGAHFFLWQMATAVAAYLLQINPFAQPEAQQVQQRVQELLAAYQQQGHLPPGKAAPINAASLHTFLSQIQLGDYVVVQAFVPVTDENEATLQTFCACLRQHQPAPVILNYGSAYLHTTAQLYQGGPRTGYFLQLTIPLPLDDVHIPDPDGAPATSLSFGVLSMAQALADGQVLARNWRRMMRFHLVNGVQQDLQPLLAEMH